MNTLCFLKCISCNKTYPVDKSPLTCLHHSPYYSYLYISYYFEAIQGFIDSDSFIYDKYLPILPIREFKIHFNETRTPLIKAEKLGKKIDITNLFIKDEGKNPTGSFKDKESLIAVNAALELGVDELYVVSSGNAAVSTSAYAKKGDMKCTCLVPKDLSVGKRFLLSLYGAEVIFKKGAYEEIYKKAIDQSLPGWNVTPGYNVFRDEGIKIIGFEIWEDIGVPDFIITPCGNGTLLFGLYKAFRELMIIGKISKIPVFIGVQVKGGAPLAQALKIDEEFSIIRGVPQSIAEGIIASESFSSPKAIYGIKKSGGEIIEVTDQEIKEAIKKVIAYESVIPEPTAGAVYAGLTKLKGVGNKTVVAINTANGFKNLKEIMESYLS